MHSVHQHRATSRYGRTVQYIKWISFTSSQMSWRLVKIKSKNKSSSQLFFNFPISLNARKKIKKVMKFFYCSSIVHFFLSSNLFVVMYWQISNTIQMRSWCFMIRIKCVALVIRIIWWYNNIQVLGIIIPHFLFVFCFLFILHIF